MPDKEGKPSRTRAAATPEDFPTTPSSHTGYPSGDYSYTVELVSAIQHQLGALTEAVNSLKDQTKEQGKKLDDVRMDVHAAKAGGKTLLWVVGIVGTLLGLFLAAYFRQLISGGGKPSP
jgi:hypothetical protein